MRCDIFRCSFVVFSSINLERLLLRSRKVGRNEKSIRRMLIVLEGFHFFWSFYHPVNPSCVSFVKFFSQPFHFDDPFTVHFGSHFVYPQITLIAELLLCVSSGPCSYHQPLSEVKSIFYEFSVLST